MAAENGHAEVKELQQQDPQEPEFSFGELGASGMTVYGNTALIEYNPDLRGPNGILVYDKMRRGDGQVRATLRLVKAPITSAQWYMLPANDSPEATEQAEFAWWALSERLNRPWIHFMYEALLFLDYGFYLFEKVWENDVWTPEPDPDTPGRKRPRSRPVVVLSKLAPRHPMSIQAWNFDDSGELISVNHGKWTTGHYEMVPIPVDRLVILTFDEEANDPTGISILRSAYKHWYYKDNLYKVDAIQKERHGIGIPIITLPPNFSKSDKDFANQLGRNLRTNEKAYVTLPPGFTLTFAEIRTQLVDALRSAEHHDLLIARNVLGQFINMGHGGGGQGSSSSGRTQQIQERVFSKALRYVADLVCQTITQDVVRPLVRFNYGPQDDYPELRVRRIDEGADWRALSVALRNFKESGYITPTADDEEYLRDQMDLPLADQDVMQRGFESRIKPPVPQPTAGGNVSSEKNNKAAGKSRSGGPNEV